MNMSTTDEREALIHTLRSFGLAYPEDMFGPVTEAERKEHGNLITRNSAAMGRHCAKFMAQAADMIEALAQQAPTPATREPAAPVDARDVCAWTQDEWECDYWCTTCGEAYSFSCDPTEYKALRFCCYCGKHMKLVPFVLPADEATAPAEGKT